MKNIVVKSGNIVMEEVDAIVTLINSEKVWFGGVDQAILSIADQKYHQIPASMNLHDGQAVVAKGNHRQHRGLFNDVIFIVDDLQRPLSELVLTALRQARESGYKSISLPIMRTGIMLGQVEPNKEATIKEMVTGIKNFRKEYPAALKINIVVFRDEEAFQLLNKMLS